MYNMSRLGFCIEVRSWSRCDKDNLLRESKRKLKESHPKYEIKVSFPLLLSRAYFYLFFWFPELHSINPLKKSEHQYSLFRIGQL
jgi:hypothetical protein